MCGSSHADKAVLFLLRPDVSIWRVNLRTCGSCGRSLKQSAHTQKVTSWFVTQNDLQKHSPTMSLLLISISNKTNHQLHDVCFFESKKQPSTTQNHATKSFKKETYIWVHLVASFGFLTSGSTILCLQQILPLPTLQASSYKWSDIRWGHPSPLSMEWGEGSLRKLTATCRGPLCMILVKMDDL